MPTAILLFLSLLCMAAPLRATEILEAHFHKLGGVQVRLESLPTLPPQGGFFAVRLSIQNHTLQAMKWTLDSLSQRQEATFLFRRSVQLRSSNTILVPANEEREVELMIPVVASRKQVSVTFSLKTAALPQIQGIFPTAFSAPHTTSLSMALDASLPEKFKNTLQSGKVSQLDPKLFSSDWRAYSGYFHLVIATATWLQLEEEQQDAIKDWCALGGDLILVSSPDIGASLPEEGPYGFGTITVISPKTCLLDLQATKGQQISEGAAWFNPQQCPQQRFLWAVLLGAAFAILMGPINLFIFAPVSKRGRLLWTIPLLSGGASLLFVYVIFVQQGIGGEGSRELLAFQLPEEGITALWQEQSSHTGFLRNTKFESTGSIALYTLPFGSYLPQSSYSLKNGKWTGDWFLPAFWQTHIAATIQPSAHPIVLSPGEKRTPPYFQGDPNIESLFYVRPDSSIWRWDGNGSLRPSSQSEFEAWLNKMEFTPFLRRHVNRVCAQIFSSHKTNPPVSLGEKSPPFVNGLVFAKYRNFPAISTLPSIRWTDVSALLITPPSLP